MNAIGHKKFHLIKANPCSDYANCMECSQNCPSLLDLIMSNVSTSACSSKAQGDLR